MNNDDDNNIQDDSFESEDLEQVQNTGIVAGKAIANKAKNTTKAVVAKIKKTISDMIPPKVKFYIFIAILVIVLVIILLVAIIYLLDIEKGSKNKLKDGETEPFRLLVANR